LRFSITQECKRERLRSSRGLNRIQNNDLSSRLLAQVIDKLANLFGDLFFGEFLLYAVTRLLQGGDQHAAVALRSIGFLIPVRNLLGAHQHKRAKAKIQITVDSDAVAQNRVELLAR